MDNKKVGYIKLPDDYHVYNGYGKLFGFTNTFLISKDFLNNKKS